MEPHLNKTTNEPYFPEILLPDYLSDLDIKKINTLYKDECKKRKLSKKGKFI